MEHQQWLDSIGGHETDPEKGERCALCFRYNLSEAAEEAEKLGIGHFTTTLTISPHKSSSLIFSIGDKTPGFTPIDFKKDGGYQRSIEISKELSLYRQRYCGCEFSLPASGQQQKTDGHYSHTS